VGFSDDGTALGASLGACVGGPVTTNTGRNLGFTVLGANELGMAVDGLSDGVQVDVTVGLLVVGLVLGAVDGATVVGDFVGSKLVGTPVEGNVVAVGSKLVEGRMLADGDTDDDGCGL